MTACQMFELFIMKEGKSQKEKKMLACEKMLLK